MAATDSVPCFYDGQNSDFDHPIKVQTRARCRQLKRMGIGRFERHGKVFYYNQRIETAVIFSPPPSAKTILTFLKTRTDGTPLHYEIPMANDLGARRHGIFGCGGDGVLRTHQRQVSKRLPNEVAIAQMSADFNWRKRLKNVQVIPA